MGGTLNNNRMPKPLFFALALSILLHAKTTEAKFCKTWSAPKSEGMLDRKFVPEASGLAASVKFPGRYYWVNDSGNKDRLYQSSINGTGIKTIPLKDTKFRDTEALSVAPCGEDSCVLVGDVGNNSGKKRNPAVYVFKESELEGSTATPFRKVEFTYPDGPHDVEAMAVLPDGQLILITKELSLMNSAEPAIFALTKSEWLEGSGTPEAKRIGTLPIRQWLPDRGFLGTAVTDIAVNSARGVLGVLTYAALVETPIEKLGQRDAEFSLVPVKALKQQETLTYDLKGERVIWSSEFLPPSAPIFSMMCERTDF